MKTKSSMLSDFLAVGASCKWWYMQREMHMPRQAARQIIVTQETHRIVHGRGCTGQPTCMPECY